MNDNVKRKIKKLLRLARDNGNANERERALEAANDLLAKHNLEMSEISIEDADYILDYGGRLDAWHNNIAIAIEMLFFVKGIRSQFLANGRRVNKLGFAGKPDNVAAAFEIFAFLTASIRSEAKRYATNRDAFLNGAADGVYIKAKQIIAKEESLKRSNSDCTALAVLRDSEEQKIEDYLQSSHGANGVYKPRKKPLDFDTYQAGVRHGLSMSLKAPATKRVEVKS